MGLSILGLLVFVAVFAPFIATHDPDGRLLGVEQGVKQRAAPCIHILGCPEDQPQHLFGTDG
ncbi:MAG: ABC transporter permease, partial [Chloroflexi bacterium]|nr:ABC transporter permease [Chloroflexota bacterium]